MAAVPPPYTLDNLPNGFIYDPQRNSIYTPAFREFCTLNADNSVNCPPLTYDSVDQFVGMHIFIRDHKEELKLGRQKYRDEMLKLYDSSLVTNLDRIRDREKWVTLTCCLFVLFCAAVGLPITFYKWYNGVLI